MQKEEWKPFRNALDKSEERKKFDEMWDIPRWYKSINNKPSCHKLRISFHLQGN